MQTNIPWFTSLFCLFLIRGEVSCCFLSHSQSETKKKQRRERSRVWIDINKRTEAGFRSFRFLWPQWGELGGHANTSWLPLVYLCIYQPKDYFFAFGRPALWSAVTEGARSDTSWLSHFSGCHNSSRNIWSLKHGRETSVFPPPPSLRSSLVRAPSYNRSGGDSKWWNFSQKEKNLFCLYVTWKKKRCMKTSVMKQNGVFFFLIWYRCRIAF